MKRLPSTQAHARADPPKSWECPACSHAARSVARRNRRVEFRCTNGECGLLFEVMAPRDFAQAQGLTPFATRRRIQGRKPWRHGGKPLVANEIECEDISTTPEMKESRTACNGRLSVSVREIVARGGGAMPASPGHQDEV
jgi:hypothetical protein